jgi:hypothetical protein
MLAGSRHASGAFRPNRTRTRGAAAAALICHRPADGSASEACRRLSGSDREFPALTGRSGTQRARRLAVAHGPWQLWSSLPPSWLRITRVFPCAARGFKACASFMSAGCCWWRSLAIDGGSETSRGHGDELRFRFTTHMSARCTLDPVINVPGESRESDEADKNDQAYDPASKWPQVTINKAEETFRELQAMPVEHLVGGLAAVEPDPRDAYARELNRRLTEAISKLTAETVTSRESSERRTAELNASLTGLTAKIVTFQGSTEASAARLERLTRWLIGFTVTLVLLTLAVVALSAVIAANAG